MVRLLGKTTSGIAVTVHLDITPHKTGENAHSPTKSQQGRTTMADATKGQLVQLLVLMALVLPGTYGGSHYVKA